MPKKWNRKMFRKTQLNVMQDLAKHYPAKVVWDEKFCNILTWYSLIDKGVLADGQLNSEGKKVTAQFWPNQYPNLGISNG